MGLSLSAPSGTLQQAFGAMKQARMERCNTVDHPAAEQEPVAALSTEAGSNSNHIRTPPEAVASTTSATFPTTSLTSTATPSPPHSAGRVSPPPKSVQSQNITSDSSPPHQSTHETTPSQLLPATSIPPSSSNISPPSTQTSVPAVPGSQLSSSSVSSVTGGPISAQPPPSSQSQVQSQSGESEGAETQTKAAGRDDIQALDKKLRSLFKDQSSASSSSVDPSQNTGTSSPPTGTSSPPPGLAVVPPSNLPLTSGTQGVLGPATTPGQGGTPAGHAQTPPTKPRAQVSESYNIQK